MKTEATPEAPTEANTEDARHGLITVLSLPLLHRDSVTEGWRNKAPHLWPGLPNMPEAGYTALDGYPFSPQEARVCLADLEAMSLAALSGMPLQALAAQDNRVRNIRELEEKDSLRHFAATGEDAQTDSLRARDDVVRKAAHKALLWAWLLEERQREVRDLTSSFDSNASHIIDALGVEEDADWAGLHAVGMQFGQDAGLLPPWKLVVQNAALFLPDACTLVVNDARMAEAMTENCAHPASLEEVDASVHLHLGLPARTGMVWARATLPLWKIAGLSAASPQCSQFSRLPRLAWLQRTAHILFPVPRTAHAADEGEVA